MKYNVTLKATVEAESAEAAERMAFEKCAGSAGEVEATAIPTREWNVSVEVRPALTFSVTVNAESAEDAEDKASELLENEAYSSGGISGLIDLADDWIEIADLDIDASDATPVENEDDEEPAPAIGLM